MRVLFLLSQRPELTGSGITVDALVRHAAKAGHEPWLLCGVPVGEAVPQVGGLPAQRILTVTFGPGGDLPFPVPGMSDVMPYPSTVWSTMSDRQLDDYRDVWQAALLRAAAACRPDLIHTNHCWLLSALLPDTLPEIPAVAHCHSTGLRQMQLCPSLGDVVRPGLRRLAGFMALHPGQAADLQTALGPGIGPIHEVGAGYRDTVFHERDGASARERRGHLVFVGKFAAAKGLPWLLDACEARWRKGDRFILHIAGDGAGDEADSLRTRMKTLSPRVIMHGRLDQPALADLLRRCAVLVLPSLYEGLPLVLAEARACGCRVVSTALPGVLSSLAPGLGDALTLVPPPRLDGPDTPIAEDLPAFTADLGQALAAALAGPLMPLRVGELEQFTWQAVFRRVARAWTSLAAGLA